MKNIFTKIALFIILTIISLNISSAECPFKFVVWGDSQFNNPEVFEKAVKETNLLKPDFVIQVGDLINGYSYDKEKIRQEWQRFKKQIEPLKVPYYPVPGNHDITTTQVLSLYGEVWGNDKYYYSFDYQNSHFIILNNIYPGKMDTIPDDQMEWFKKDLEKNKNAENIFAFFHSPLYTMNEFNWEPIHNMLKKYPFRAFFAGHSHTYDFREKDGIKYFVVNTSGEIFKKNHLTGHSQGFMVVSVDKTKIDYAYIADGSIFPHDAVIDGEAGRAGKYYEPDNTYIIPDSSMDDVRHSITIPIKNNTNEERSYKIRWETDNFSFRFDPPGAKFNLAPDESKEIPFNLLIPKGKYFREDLPKLKIESPYKNKAGSETVITSYQYLFAPPETQSIRKTGEFNFDGIIDDEIWKSAPEINQLYLDKKGTPAKEKTIIKVIYDDESIYVGIKGDEPNPKGLKSNAGGKLPLVFADDDFEVYFDTYRDLKTFYRLMTNPVGTVLCSRPKGLFTFKFDVKTFVGGNFWSAEFKIPYTEIGAKVPRKDDVWGMNIRRSRQQDGGTVSDWSRMRGFPAQPEFFGILKFN